MKLQKLWMMLIVLGMSAQASAGLLLDPYVGISSSASKIEIDGFSSLTDDETSTATVAGARVGYSFILLSAGLDYQMMSGDDANEDSSTISSTSFFVGVDLPILLRFWGKYIFSSEFSGDTADKFDFAYKDGYAVGIGFTALPFVSINLEVQALNYDLEYGSIDGTYSVGSTILSLSIPLDF
jgi:hypothetical protein